MLTIFTIPKPFNRENHIDTIQNNAILSWKNMGFEVILVGDDRGIQPQEGVRFNAEKSGVEYVENVKLSAQGTPLLNSAFELVRQKTKHKTLCYANADIIFLPDMTDAIKKLPQNNFLAVGRRIDADITNLLDFNGESWVDEAKVKSNNGKLHSYSGIDYFIFNKNDFRELPDLVVGRIGWDHWMIKNAKQNKFKVIDCTKSISAIHQNHGYPSYNQGKQRKINPDARHNRSFVGKKRWDCTIEDANSKLVRGKIKYQPFHWLPFVKRWIREYKR